MKQELRIILEQSDLWTSIFREYSDIFDLESFREPNSINSRLAAWNPKENSWRWHRSFLLLAANQLTKNQLEIYRNFGKVKLGRPIEVILFDRNLIEDPLFINIDYLLSLHEIIFLKSFFNKRKFPKTIYEVGAGFGRTCHAFLKWNRAITSYVIIDLPKMLDISRLYLQRVLDDSDFNKISFLDASELDFNSSDFDLGIQIDGLQEMTDTTINYYFSNYFNKSKYFFTSNPIAKYKPEHAGLENVSEEVLNMVTSLGRSREIVDIWNMKELDHVRSIHVKNYSTVDSKVVRSKPNPLFPHFEMTLYKNS
jgi:putative sugar O-methyltransferase